MRKLKLLLGLLALIGEWIPVKAYTVTDLTNAGWKSVTDISSLTLSDYYFIFIDGQENKYAVTNAMPKGTKNDKNESTVARPMFKEVEDPFADFCQVWTIEANGTVSDNTVYAVQSIADNYFINSNGEWWSFHISSGKDQSKHQFNYISDGKYRIRNTVNTGENNYWGPYKDNPTVDLNFNEGMDLVTDASDVKYAALSGNKSEANGPGFYLYCMKREEYNAHRIYSSTFTANGWTKVTATSQLGLANHYYLFVDASEFFAGETGFAMTGTNDRPIYKLLADPTTTTTQLWTTETHGAGYAIKNVNTNKYVYAAASWNIQSTNTVETNNTDFIFTLNDGAWTLSNSISTSEFVGNYKNSPYSPTDGEGLAANKATLKGKRSFCIYSIHPTISTIANKLPSNNAMEGNKWYVYDIVKAGDYEISITGTGDVVYTQDGTQYLESVAATNATSTITLTEGKLYLKASSDVTINIYTWLYLSTTVNGDTKWLNTNSSDENKAYVSDFGLPFMLEKDADDNYYLKFSDGNYLRDRGDNWVVLTTGKDNNKWKLHPEDGGYKLLLPANTDCELVVADTSTGLVDMTHDVAGGGSIWQFATPAEAIAQAKAKAESKLGFEKGEYAPYNNITAIRAFSTAATATTNSARISAYAGLASASWTANDSEVNAIYWDYSTLATTEKSEALGWYDPALSGNAEGSHYSTRVFNHVSSNPGLNAVTNHVALFTKKSTNYGKVEGYTLPLKANRTYKLSFKYAGWTEPSESTISITDENDANPIKISGVITVSDNAVNGNSSTEAWADYVGYFTVPSDGNYILNINRINMGNNVQRQLVMGNISLMSADALVFADRFEVPTYAPGTYPTVKITRTLTAGRWATAVYPFAVSGVDNIAVLDSYDKTTGALGFTTAAASTANEPFFMRSTAGTTEITLSNVAVEAVEAAPVATKSEAKLKGAYTTANITNTEKNYVLSDNKIYSVGEAGATIKPYRAYIQIEQDAVSARGLSFFVDGGETTGISQIENEELNIENSVYNLNGQRVAHPKKGLYIVNGKKVVVKK